MQGSGIVQGSNILRSDAGYSALADCTPDRYMKSGLMLTAVLEKMWGNHGSIRCMDSRPQIPQDVFGALSVMHIFSRDNQNK